jgi:hypothetical protein
LKRTIQKADVKGPEKFSGKVRTWKPWKAEFEAHLAQATGSNPNETPLLYVIRDDDDITTEEYELLEGQMKKVYDAPLHGEHFMRDNFQVYQKLRTLLTGGIAETYLTDYEKTGNGRGAWKELLVAYEGEDATNTAITSARNDIRTTTWERNTKNWTFDQYCLKHIRANNILKKYGVPLDETTKVREFIRGINNASLQSIKTSILLNKDTKTNLNKAIIEFKDTVTALDLAVFDKANTNDERKISATNSQLGNNRGGYRGGYRGRGGFKNSPYHKPNEYSRRGGHQGRSNTNYRGRGGGRSHPYPKRGGDGLLLDQSILDQMNAKQRKAYYEGRTRLQNQGTQQPSDSEVTRQIGAANTENNDDASRMTSASTAFGRASSQSVTPSNRQLGNERRSQGRITTGERRIAAATQLRNDLRSISNDYTRMGRAEIDTRADTTCAGSTFLPLEFTGQECDVNGFHDDMTPIKNVPVATCATAYDHVGLQETIILVFHETLYVGPAMEHSLLNPNQIQANGLIVDTCPRQYDKSSLHAIVHTKEDITMPLAMYGCISYLPT